MPLVPPVCVYTRGGAWNRKLGGTGGTRGTCSSTALRCLPARQDYPCLDGRSADTIFLVQFQNSTQAAQTLLACLREGNDGSLILSRPVKQTGWESILCRISYNPLKSMRNNLTLSDDEIVVTYRKKPIKKVKNLELKHLEATLRNLNIRLWMEAVHTQKTIHLLIPDDTILTELRRLIRLHRQWPIPEELLTQELDIEQLFSEYTNKGALILKYGGSRNNPPAFLTEHPWWTGMCSIYARRPAPGSRRTGYIEIMTAPSPSGEKTILTVRKHGRYYKELTALQNTACHAITCLQLDEHQYKPTPCLVLLPLRRRKT